MAKFQFVKLSCDLRNWNFLSKRQRHKVITTKNRREPPWFHEFYVVSNFMDFSREIKVVKSLVQNRRVFTNFMCFLNSNFLLVFQPFNSTRFWPSKSILDLKSCDFHLTLKMMSVLSRRSRWLITIFYMISECFELLDRSVVIFGDTLCFRTTVLDEQPSHIQCLSIPSSQRALKR